jgi:hypothetical protein
MIYLGVEEEEVEEQEEDVEEEVDTMDDVKAEEDNKVAHQQLDYYHWEMPHLQLQGLKKRVKGLHCLDSPGKCGLLNFHPRCS